MMVRSRCVPRWLISNAEIEATEADYLALGHWNRAVQVGTGKVPAYYSGSPDLAKTVNVVRLTHNPGRSRSHSETDFVDERDPRKSSARRGRRGSRVNLAFWVCREKYRHGFADA